MLNKFYEKLKTIIRENLFFLCSVLVIIFLFFYELPYVIYTPGGSIDLQDRIVVEDGYSSSGSLSMAYVSMMKGNLPFLLFSYLMPNWDVVKTEDILPQNETLDEMIEADRISMIEAQNNAIYSAYSLAKKEVKVKNQVNHVVLISEQADTDLELFDELLTMNGEEISDLPKLQKMVATMKSGDEVIFEVMDHGEKKERRAKVYETSEGLKVGIAMTTTYEYETNPAVEIKSKSSESGPSGGLMMALSIYNSLVSEDITNGKTIIGTGTIDHDGNVGKIGGIKYKILGAEKKKADIFLVPEENYAEAIEVKNENDLEIRIISVRTLKEAIEAIS